MCGYRFVVVNESTLSYSSKQGQKAKATFDLTAITISPHSKKQTVIVIDAKDHHFFFKCKNIAEKLEWLQAMEANQFIAKHNNEVVINNPVLMKKESVKDRAYSVLPTAKKLQADEETKGFAGHESDDASDDGGFSSSASPDIAGTNQENKEKQYEGELNDYPPVNGVIHKDEILESLAKIFYDTQMLSNDSPVTKELVGIENNASKIHDDLKGVLELLNGNENTDQLNAKASKDIIMEAIVDVQSLRLCLENLINNFEGIREKMYPVAEKIALIELEKNPFRIPGEPYK